MSNLSRPRFLKNILWAELSERLRVHLGIDYSDERERDLQQRIKAAAVAFGMASAEVCARWLLSAPLTQKHIEILATYLTVGETYFFRDQQSFQVLEELILSHLLQKRSSNRQLRIWSAGCCTGEEPYSIAILLAKIIPNLCDWKITILATDINGDYLKKGNQGIFNEWSFRGSLLKDREKLFRKTQNGHFEIAQEIRKMVRFSYLNLAKDLFPSVENNTNAMDIIFCRNVLMYFEQSQALEVIQKLEQSLCECGYLFLSPVEIPNKVLPGLTPIHFPGGIIYQKDSHYTQKEQIILSPPPPSTEQISSPAQINQNDESQTRCQEALELYNKGYYEESAQKILVILNGAPNHGKAMALLARNYANLGHLIQAKSWCEKAITTDKLNANWCYLYSTILQELRLYSQAAAILRRALYLDEKNALFNFSLGNLILRKGKQEDARKYFENALEILSAYQLDQILPESEGITVGMLIKLIKSTIRIRSETKS